jgi:hypothetical protein
VAIRKELAAREVKELEMLDPKKVFQLGARQMERRMFTAADVANQVVNSFLG